MTDGSATLSAASMARLAAVVLAAFYLPPLLIHGGIVPFGWRFLAPLCIGLVWGAIYRTWPNLWGLMLSHAVLGLISIAIGLV